MASRNPSSKSRGNRTAVTAGVLLAATAGAAYYFWPRTADVSPAAGGFALPVEATPALQQPLAETLTVVGQVIANRGVDVTSEISGKVSKIAFDEGKPVKAGALLIQLDDSVLRAQLAQAEANLKLAENNVGRYQRLLAEQAPSQQQADAAVADVKLARANVQLARANLDKAYLRAPFDGIAGIRQVDLGEYVTPGSVLVNVTENARLRVTFRVPETQANDVKAGANVRITADNGVEVEAPISAIDSRVDPTSRTREVQVFLDNRENHLTAGQFVRVTLPLRGANDAVVVPDQALVPMGNQTFAYVITDGPKGATLSSRTEVTVGLRNDGQVQVTSGIKPGQMVVTAGQQKLQAPVMPVMVLSPTQITVRETPVENLK